MSAPEPAKAVEWASVGEPWEPASPPHGIRSLISAGLYQLVEADRLKNVGGVGHCRRQIDQDTARRGPGAQDRRQERPGAAADIDHAAHTVPTAAD